MKNNLWIFGDSLSVGYNPFNTNGYLFPTDNWWSNILAHKLNFECINPSGVGNSNYQIRHKFYENFGDIKENDIVIFQFTFENRINFEPGNISIENIKNLNLDDIIINEWNYKWNIFYPKIIKWLNDKNVKVLFWSSENNVPNNILNENWIELPAGKYGVWENWLNVTDSLWIKNEDGRVDKHFNQYGHKLFADFIYLKIKSIYLL